MPDGQVTVDADEAPCLLQHLDGLANLDVGERESDGQRGRGIVHLEQPALRPIEVGRGRRRDGGQPWVHWVPANPASRHRRRHRAQRASVSAGVLTVLVAPFRTTEVATVFERIMSVPFNSRRRGKRQALCR